MANPTILDLPSDLSSATDYPAISTGSNRLVCFDVCYAKASAGNVTTPDVVTIGGVSATYIAGDAPASVVDRVSNTTWAITESQISSMSGSAIVVSGGINGTVNRRLGYVVQDAKQSGFNSAKQWIATGGLSISLNRAADSLSFFSVYGVVNETLTLANPARVGSITNVNYGYAADTERTANTTSQSKSYIQNGHIINFEPLPAQSITSVNDDELDSGVENTAVVVGYDDGVNPVVSGTVGLLAVTDVSQTDDVVTFTIPEPENASYWPEPDTTQTLTLEDADENAATFDAPFNSLPSHTSVLIDTPDNEDPNKLGANLDYDLEDGDRIMFVSADWTVNADGSYENATAGVKVFVHWRQATSLAYVYEATIGGEIVTPEITSVGTIRIGGTTAIIVSGFSGPVTSGTIDNIALETANDTSIKTFAIADGENVPRPGTRSLYLTDGTDDDTVDATVAAPTGWSSYTITADFVQAINGVATVYLPVGWTLGDFILSPDVPSSGKTTTVENSGIITSNIGVQELFLVDAVTGLASAFTVTTTEGAGSGGSGSTYHGRFLKGSYV